MRWFQKLFFFTSVALFLASGLYAQSYTPQEAAQHIGETATIQGVVVQVSSSKGTTFINFGGRFPNHIFYAVIFDDYADLFPGVHDLEGRTLAISGEISPYRGKPQIILTSPDQLSLP